MLGFLADTRVVKPVIDYVVDYFTRGATDEAREFAHETVDHALRRAPAVVGAATFAATAAPVALLTAAVADLAVNRHGGVAREILNLPTSTLTAYRTYQEKNVPVVTDEGPNGPTVETVDVDGYEFVMLEDEENKKKEENEEKAESTRKLTA